MTGYFISSNFEVMLKVCEHATKSGTKLAFNISHGVMFYYYPEQVRKLLPHLDVIFANEEEMDKWAEF